MLQRECSERSQYVVLVEVDRGRRWLGVAREWRLRGLEADQDPENVIATSGGP